MRIRSIKPEFWSHPVLGKLPDESRLGALGLLNIADDEGYFLAAPALIRSALWPLDEDSTKARRVLAQLSEVGYIEVREHPTHGPVGMVINFKKHQRVDRPSPSRIKAYYDSTNARRMLDERSCPDQGSRDQGIKGAGSEGSADDQDIGSPSTAPQAPPSDRDHFRMQLVGEPWVKDLKRAMCKIGPENWQAWQGMVQEWGLPAVISAARGVPATDRWPDQVDKTLTASRGQQNPGEVIKDRIVRMTL